jgi:SAM-dependent methyltransferase
VDNYVRYRPGYPAEVIDVLARETGLTTHSEIADAGSGTGISSELFLCNGNTVFGVEPNNEMRDAAERLLAAYPRFHSVAARAEATNLPGASVDYVTAGQAFHWFDPELARTEFARILRPDGWVVLLWNARRLDSTPFLREYESLLERFGTDYREVRHQNFDVSRVRALFDGEIGDAFQLRKLYNEQRLDFEGLRGRLLSSSYTPAVGHPGYLPMLRELRRIFDEHAVGGSVAIEYDTDIYFGRLA